MRKIILGAFVSLDGIMQAPGGPDEDPIGGFPFGGWAVPHFDDVMGAAVGEMFAAPFDLLLGADALAAVRELKRGDGPNLLTQGSTDFLTSLFAHELVDEINVSVFPVMLGHGKRLFANGAQPKALKLVSSRTTGSGVTVNRYTIAGAITTGSFEFEQPTGAELARRRNLT